MRLDPAFRLSTYLTLAIASLCLSCAEGTFIPGLPLFGLGLAVLLGVAFAVEGRWALPAWASNVLGLVIGVGSCVWIAYQFWRAPAELQQVAPWARELPYLGPVLMVLLLAKMFRPKQSQDIWLIHSISLMEVTLACVLTGDFQLSGFLIAYVVCALWSLALFSLHRGKVAAAVKPAQRSAAPALVPWRFLGFGAAMRWGLVILGAGLVLFLITPQHRAVEWNPFIMSQRMAAGAQTGLGGEMDLNRTGRIELGHEVVMEVLAQDAQQNPKLDLDPDQHWRGLFLETYEGGRWLANLFAGPLPWSMYPFRRDRRRPVELPDMGPHQYFLTFTIDRPQAIGFVLAEPVPFGDRGEAPVAPVDTQNNPSWMPQRTGIARRGPLRYRQVVALAPEPEVGPALGIRRLGPSRQELVPLRSAGVEPLTEISRLRRSIYCKQPIEGINVWTAELLQRLVAEDTLAAAEVARDSDDGVLPEHWEKVARTLTHYLAFSGEYKYTLDHRRKRRELDPTEDFLCNVKQGHCELYATGLALMLRSCQIPSRIVVGFRGWESLGDGHYLVRQNNAHSWVQALIQRPGPRGQPQLHWLTLDPTPAGEAVDSSSAWLVWWPALGQILQTFWRDYVLEYNTDQQSQVFAEFWYWLALRQRLQAVRSWVQDTLQSPPSARWLLAMAAAGMLGWLAWKYGCRARVSQRPVEDTSVPTFYRRLLQMLARSHRLRPQPAQTPHEFGATAERALQAQPSTALLAGLPRRAAWLFYRIRYGRRPLEPHEEQAIEQQIDELETALKGAGPTDR